MCGQLVLLSPYREARCVVRVIETMRKDDLKPYVDISRFDKPGLYNVSVKCWSDRDGVNIRSIYPESISVKIEKSAAK